MIKQHGHGAAIMVKVSALAATTAATLMAAMVGLATVAPSTTALAETLKIASPQRGTWEGAVPELGQQVGIFKKHGLDLDILYTAGSGETMQTVISGSVDVGLSGGSLAVFGAFAKGAPIRIIGGSSSGAGENFWYVRADNPLQSLKEAHGRSLAFSTNGASTHVGVLRFIKDYALKDAKPIATGDVNITFTQVMSGQIDAGYSVTPVHLDAVDDGRIRIIGRAYDVPHLRGQTIRVQVANARVLSEKKEAIVRYLQAYRETVDWMYASDDAVQRYLKFSGFSERSVRRTLAEFITKASLQTEEVKGIASIQEDAVQYKFLAQPLTAEQLVELIQIGALAAK